MDELEPGAPELLHERVHVELDLERGRVALDAGRAAGEGSPDDTTHNLCIQHFELKNLVNWVKKRKNEPFIKNWGSG